MGNSVLLVGVGAGCIMTRRSPISSHAMSRAARLGPDGLTIKEEKFCERYFATGEGADAYRESYGVDPSKDGPWVVEEASRLVGKPHIQKRLEALRAKSESIAIYTADKAMAEAREAYDLAKKTLAPDAMVSAVSRLSQLAGLLVEKREVTSKTLKTATPEELMAELDRLSGEAGLVIQRAKTKVPS